MEIRRANLNDYSQLCGLFEEVDELHRQAMPEVFKRPSGPARSRSYLNRLLADKNAALLVAEEKGELLGLLHIFVQEVKDIPLLKPRKLVFVENLVVKKGFRKKGIGKKLMQEGVNWTLSQGASLIELNVWEFNQEARKFYQKLDFETLSRKLWKKVA